MPEIDVLAFCRGPPSDDRKLRFCDLKGLEHIKHIFLDAKHTSDLDFEVGCDPKAMPSGNVLKYTEIQMVRIGLREFIPTCDHRVSMFCPEYFPNLRFLTIHQHGVHEYCYCGARRSTKDCCCSSSSTSNAPSFCKGAVRFHLGKMNIDEATRELIQTRYGLRTWGGRLRVLPYIDLLEGPIITTREGSSGVVDKLQWLRIVGGF